MDLLSRTEDGSKCGTDDEVEKTEADMEDGTEKYRGFVVLDEFDANENDDVKEELESNSSDDLEVSDSEFDLPEDELEAMLDEGLPEEFRARKRLKRDHGGETEDKEPMPYREREKVVLEEKVRNHFEVLPEGWVQVTHNSGMPIYLHRPSRVCTLTKPYFLGTGSARKHAIPLSAVPCLQYRRALDKEQEANNKPGTCPVESGLPVPSARIETVQENQATHSVNATELREYCSKLFRFRTIKLLRFKSWAARRKFAKLRKQRHITGASQASLAAQPASASNQNLNGRDVGRPTLPVGTKLITFPIGPPQTPADPGNETTQGSSTSSNTTSLPRREWIMNPAGKSYVCILHEYVQHALKKQPCYQFKEIENAATPYSATVLISGMQYGTGVGSSKKAAKAEAAKATLDVLIPQMREKILSDSQPGNRGPSHSSDIDLSFFDDIRIEDPRVAELCAKTSEPSPYAILLTCLQRNFGLGDKNVKYELKTLKHQRNEVTMTVGKHTVCVQCKNKRDGKQRAAQAILQALHPHVTSWGSLLRLYGSHSLKSVKEKKQEEQQITLLQSKAAVNAPNVAILNKLREEMVKLRERRQAMQPIGKFVPPEDVDLPAASGADLNNVDL